MHCRSVLCILNFRPADDQLGISLAAHKLIAVKLLLLGKAYILFLKEVRDCYGAFLFSPGSIHVLDISFNCFFLALKAQPSSGVQVGLQMRQEAGEETFCV